jgi:membrane protein involved in colicin uptake
MSDVVEVDAGTGVQIERDYTPDEAAQRAADAEAARLADVEREADAQARATARAALLTRLGITSDEADLLASAL